VPPWNADGIDTMGALAIAVSLLSWVWLPPQTPAAAKPAARPLPPAAGTSLSPIRFDANGHPIVPEDVRQAAEPTPPPAAPSGESAARPAAGDTASREAAAVPAGRQRDEADLPPLASGMQLGSPLLDVYQATRSPWAFQELGGVVGWWRLTVYGEQGEQLGVREVSHLADCAFAERDRLEHGDGRTFGRIGAQTFAERRGMPAPANTDLAQQELMLFGLHLRLPWLFADANAFVVTGREVEERSGERLVKILLERRPPPALDLLGPEAEPKPRDRFELFCEPSTGLPREFVHRFASTRQTRRVLLEDWRETDGVRLPHRRVYVDESLRPTTVMELLRLERQRVTDRDFRLH
jgi:hypothetical protein